MVHGEIGFLLGHYLTALCIKIVTVWTSVVLHDYVAVSPAIHLFCPQNTVQIINYSLAESLSVSSSR